jgi:uncharacterized repeat protein (TIGR02059 family)
MNNQHYSVRQYSMIRLLLVGLLLSVTLAVSVASRATVVKADTGEAPFGTPTQALQAAMSLGSRHTCVITNGNLLCWGDNTLGQLGNGSSGTSANSRPTYVVDSQSSPTTPLAGVVGVIAATDHTCALINTGKVKCWGYGWKIGKYVANGNASPYPTFVKDSWINTQAQSDASGDLTGVVGLAASTYNSCALINDGKVKCWGDDTGGGKLYRGTGYVLHCADDSFSVSCGSGSTSNVPISNIKSINMSNQSACAIKNDANLTQLCWGNTDAYGYTTQTGENSRMYASSAHSGVNGAKAFSIGQRTVCGLFEKVAGQAISVSGGQVKCWGMNGSKTLGRGDTLPDNISDRYNAANVPGLDNAIAISGEMDTFCALLIDRTVKCWGNNQPSKTGTGQIGFANGTPLPMRVGDINSAVLTDIYAVTVGADHVCIITGVTGNVKCSGTNTNGQIGDGTVTAKAVLTEVKAVSGNGNLEGAGADNMPPTLSSIAVNTAGTKVVLTFNELLATSGSIPTGQFVVKVGGVTKTVSSVTVDGQTVELNMVERITPGVVVRMSYTDPTGSDDTNIIEDASYNDAATISERDITNNSTTEADAPTLVSAAVNAAGTSLTLTYNEALNSTTALTSAFAVTVGGVTRSVTGAVVSGSTVVLTLASAALAGATVTVAYTAPTADLATTNNAIQDTAGNDAVSFNSSAVAVTNGSTFDNVSPVFQSAAVSGDKTKVVLTYNEALGATTALTTAFTVKVNTVTRTVTGVAVNGSTVELTLQSVVSPGDTVTVQYTAPAVNTATSNTAIQDTSGNDALLIAAGTSVANVEDTTAPTFVSGAVNAGGSLVLTYSETLAAAAPATSTIVVTINGTAVTVSSVSIVGSTIVVVTSPVIGTGDVVTFRYTDPTAGNDTNAIQDSAGNDVASSSSAYSVPSANNDSTVDTTAPTFVSGAVNTSGRLVLTYSEALAAPLAATSTMVVTVNGTAVTVSSVSIVGSTVVVVTSPEIQRGDVVTFRYTDPTTGNDANAIQDAAGNDVASSSSAYSISGGSNASSIDTTAPTFVSGAVNTGGSLLLTYSETLGSTAPATSSIVVTINGTSVTVVSVSIVGSTVVIVTSPVIGTGDVVTFRYTDPTSGNDANAIEDAAGNDVASSSSAYSVPGSSNRSTIDTNPPGGVTIGVDTGGTKITITFDEDLSSTGPSTTDFTVTVDGVQYTVIKTEIVDGDLVLTVSPSIKTGQSVVVSYRDPTSGNDGNALQDADGNDIPSFGDVKSKNSSTQASAVNQADGVLDTTLPIDNETSSTSVKVDGDAPTASLSTSETQGIAGKNGKATFSDGSTFGVSKNGNLIPKLFTAYIGTVTGSVKVTYKVGKKTISSTCSYGKYGSTKPKKVTKSVNGFFPKVFISPKKTCLMPPAAIKALNTSLVTISAKLKFVRLWPTTGKPKNPESGAAVRPVKRAYSVKIGTAPK